MSYIIKNLYSPLEQKGLKGRVVAIRHLRDLRDEIESEYERGALSEVFYRERMQFYRFIHPEDLHAAGSIIIVAMPRPQTPVNFSLNGKAITLTLPPTYARYDEINHEIGEILTTLLAREGFQVAPTSLPLKLLAASSGLIEYGRNNIGYIAGMGSFFQLVGYYSDLPVAEDDWHVPRMMERCKSCQACLKKCPTGAISADRFLLHAERCLVFHNERSSAHPFPDWIEPGMHNCLMGCMICQQYCPEDKPFLGWYEESVNFSNEETRMLLKGSVRNELADETIRKLETLELMESLDLFPRNLGVFFSLEERLNPIQETGE